VRGGLQRAPTVQMGCVFKKGAISPRGGQHIKKKVKNTISLAGQKNVATTTQQRRLKQTKLTTTQNPTLKDTRWGTFVQSRELEGASQEEEIRGRVD